MHFRVEGSDVRTGAVSVRIIEASDEVDAAQRAAVFPFFRFARAVPMRRLPVWERPPGAVAPAGAADFAAAAAAPAGTAWDTAAGVDVDPPPFAGAGMDDSGEFQPPEMEPPEMEVPTAPWTERAAAPTLIVPPAPARPIPPADEAAHRPRFPWTQGPPGKATDLPEGAAPGAVRAAVAAMVVLNGAAIAALLFTRAAPVAAMDSPVGVCAFGLAANALTLAATAIAAWSHTHHRARATERLVAYAAAAALAGVFTVSFATGMGWISAPAAAAAPAAQTPVAST